MILSRITPPSQRAEPLLDRTASRTDVLAIRASRSSGGRTCVVRFVSTHLAAGGSVERDRAPGSATLDSRWFFGRRSLGSPRQALGVVRFGWAHIRSSELGGGHRQFQKNHESRPKPEGAQMRYAACCAAIVLGACAAPIVDRRWVATDGVALPGAITVVGEQSWIDGAQLSLWTWPELQPVPHTVSVEPWPAEEEEESDPRNSVAYLIPSGSLGERWYAIRWQSAAESTSSIRIVGGVPLSDGSIVWRFFAGSIPEVVRIIGVSNEVHVELSENVRPESGRTPYDVATVEQPGARCEASFGGEPIIESSIVVVCTPPLDWQAPVRVRVNGLESAEGVPVDPLDVVLQFEADEEPVFEPATSVVPPPVPTAYCAGVQCE